MAVQDYKINYKSDFVLNINGDAGWAVPFCIKFWTGMPSQAYFVGFDGVKYVNCKVGDTPTQLLVMFDDHHLPIGKLEMQIAYHTTIEEFPGSVFDEVTNARDVIVTIDGTDYQVMLDFTGEDAPELEFDLPAYANEAERIQNELQRQQNEADRIAAELQREQATAAAVQGADNVNAQLNGTTLTVTNRQGVSTSVNTKGEQGVPGPVGPEGPQGEQGVSIVSFRQVYASETATYYSITFSDGHEQSVAIPKGAKGDTGATGPQGPQGDTGVSITGLVETGETETDTLYNVTFSNGTTQQVAIPKGEKGDQGPVGPQGPQGPMGDVAVITPEQQAAFTMYSETGQNTNGPMTQKAVTDVVFEEINVDLNNLTIRKNYIKADNTWNTTVGYHAMIYVEGYSKVSVKANPSANAVVELLKSAARTGTADYATGAARTFVPIDSIITLNIPSDAKYLYVIFGADTSYQQKPDYVKLYSDKFNKLNDKLDNYTETSYAASSFPNAGLLLSDGTIQNNSTTQEYRTSDFIPVDRDMMLIYKDVFPIAGSWVGICVYNYQKQRILPNPAIGSESVNNGAVNLSQYEDVSYIRVSTNAAISTATTSIKLRKNYTLGDIAGIIDDVSGKTIMEGYGCTTSSNGSNPDNILYMSSNTPCLKSGLVEKISGTFKYAGTAVITTGFIDQNGFMITGKEYNVTIPSAGFNSINVEDKGIIINEGEFLLAKFTGNCYPNFGIGASSAVGLSVDLDSHATVRADNVYFSFAWYVNTTIPDYETLALNMSEQKNEIASLQETVANIDTSGVITDQETGIPYIITIRNGQIVLIHALYRNVLVLGNSITSHEQTSIWPANNRGMAATKPEYDFCGIMQKQMRLKDNSTVVKRLNIAEWERDFTTSLSTLIGNNLTSDTDLVVIRLGENVTNNNGFGSALNNLLAYIYSIAQNARVLVTSMFWANSATDEILKNFADSHGLTYVKINQFGYSAYEEAIGHYTYNTDFTAISEITNTGVAQHPSNKGMCAIANEILNAIGYDRSTNTYSLQSVTVGGVTGTMWVLNE